jgi:hypothetical protein
MFMRDLLAEHAKDIFRCKGVLAVHVSGMCPVTACTGHSYRLNWHSVYVIAGLLVPKSEAFQ